MLKATFHPRGIRGAIVAATLLAWSACAWPQQGPTAPLHLRVVGGLAGVNQYTRHEEPFWTRELAKRSGGRLDAEIVPFDRAGIRGPEMLRQVQIGTVPFGTALLSASASQDPELAAPDLAGLNPDFKGLQRVVAAYRPALQKMLQSRYGIELLAVYVYPAQVTFCTKPLASLSDLAGRRVRTSSATQSDMVEALGGTSVLTPFAEVVANVRSGNIDCAITGTMSGNTIGLHEVTSHIHTLPFTWGLAAFVANGTAWAALPSEHQALLRRELPKLEQAIWAESARETAEGIACNTGAATCSAGRKGSMVAVNASPADDQRRRAILVETVLPRWLQRCGPGCAALWQQTLAPVTGIALP